MAEDIFPFQKSYDGRVSRRQIADKRRAGRSRILLTGATGFLGLHLAEMLVKKGYTVFLLVRPQNGITPGQRMRELFDWLAPEAVEQSMVHVVAGDLNRPDLGLSDKDYKRLASQTDEIIHCASETSFSERKREQIEKANVENLRHLLDFAAGSACGFFHLVSTAYAAGKKSGVCPEELEEPGTFFNVYEETKHRAEKTAEAYCRHEKIRLNIYRPSIVYGDSRTGKTLRFNALYYPVRTLLFLKNLYQGKNTGQHAKNAEQMGIFFDRQGTAHLPVRIEASASCGINLVPVDFFTAAFSAIMETALDGGVFHITNERTKPVSDLIDYTREYFRIKGVRAVQPENFPSGPLNRLEILFNRYIKAYKPYMKDERIFDNRRTAAILNQNGISCPDFDYRIFSTCMQYAESVNWGNDY